MTVVRFLSSLIIAGVLLVAGAAAASATTAPVALSVRMSGTELIVNVAGVKHVCVAAGGFELGGLHAGCSTGTGAEWNGTEYGVTSPLTVTIGHVHAYRCTTPVRVSATQLRCSATVLK